MRTNDLLHILTIFCLLWGFTACSDDDMNFPTFRFDDNGMCYAPSVTPLSTEAFEQTVAGYGWTYVSTYEIKENGECIRQDYYEDLIGGGPTTYYFENRSSLKQYFYAGFIPAWGFITTGYTFEDGNRIVANGGNMLMQIISADSKTMKMVEYLGVSAGGKKIYGYSTYRRMSSDELKKVQEVFNADLNNVKDFATTVEEDPVIISGKEFEFDVLSSNGPFQFKALREGSCEITANDNHVKVKLLSNGVSLEGKDQLKICRFDIFSTDEELEPKGTDIYDFTYTEVTLTKDGKLKTPDGHELSYDYGSMELNARDEYYGSILSQYAPVALLAVDEQKQARYLRLNSGRISFKELIPQSVIDKLAAGKDGDSVSWKLELSTPSCHIFQILPFKIVYKE